VAEPRGLAIGTALKQLIGLEIFAHYKGVRPERGFKPTASLIDGAAEESPASDQKQSAVNR
jgi:hypothetical protein